MKMKKLDWVIFAALALVAGVLFFLTVSGFAYPGESARLISIWRGFEPGSDPYPLMGFFAKLFGCGNTLAPVCGALSTALLYLVVTRFVRSRMTGEFTAALADGTSRIAGVTAAVVYMLSPAVCAASTHLEPTLFTFTWWLVAAAVLIPVLSAKDLRVRIAATAVVLGAFFVVNAIGHIGDATTQTVRMIGWYSGVSSKLFVFAFATLPVIVAAFAAKRAFNDTPSASQILFHLALSLVTVLAVATPLSPAQLLEPYGVLPVSSCAFAAAVAGYLLAYWWSLFRGTARVNESLSEDSRPSGLVKIIAPAAGGLLAFVLAFNAVFGLLTIDGSKGDFADRIAGAVLDDMGEREWIVTDGLLDNHLRLVAGQRGKELGIISLDRDLDKEYLDSLAKIVRAKRLGGSRSEELAITLGIGVLPFVQDWFKADPEIAKKVVIFGTADLWYSAGINPVPETLFFGGDDSRKATLGRLEECLKILRAEKGWGSYRLGGESSLAERMRYSLLRHVGLITNNRGVAMQDAGRDDEAYELYRRVYDEIDSDNICTLFNLFAMANAKHPRAQVRKREFEGRFRKIVEDKNRRYQLWALSSYYGYIRDPMIFIRLGYQWARSGRPGEALAQVSRAADLVPDERKGTVLNMLAALYANEDDRDKSRQLYQQVLAQKGEDHDALVGMMRLALMDGDDLKAREYLSRAISAGGDDPRIDIERAMLEMMKGDLSAAKKLLRKVTDANADDIRAWSLMSSVVMQQFDAEKDETARRKLVKEIETEIFPVMEKNCTDVNDYYLQSTRAFLLLRKPGDHRREARDAFAVAAKNRPDITATQDMVLSLDIALNDHKEAEAHARDFLRRNRNSPLANYVMGSIALGRGEYDVAETYLRRAADGKKPVDLAMNDLAEVYRRTHRPEEALKYAEKAVAKNPKLYVAHETLASALMDLDRDLERAEKSLETAIELSRVDGQASDIRMFITLARIQAKNGKRKDAKITLRKMQSRIGELSEYERKEYEELLKSVK